MLVSELGLLQSLPRPESASASTTPAPDDSRQTRAPVTDGAKLCPIDDDPHMTAHHAMHRRLRLPLCLAALLVLTLRALSAAQAPAPAPQGVDVPIDYTIGPDDVLNVVFWTAKEMSHEVLVRPDGKISLPLINDVSAAGLTPLQLSENIRALATKFVRDAGNTVIVTTINSRRVYVVGEVSSPGQFPLASEMTVLQAIGQAGGFVEGANKGDVVIVRTVDGQQRRFKFDYNDVLRGRNVQQNIRLMPGDTILVR